MKYCVFDNRLFIVNKRGEVWSFHYSHPDRISLGETFVGANREEELKASCTKDMNNSDLSDLFALINKEGCGNKGNFNEVVDILCRVYQLSKEDIYKYLKYNEEAAKITDEIINGDYGISQFFDNDIYRDSCVHLQTWNDRERVKKYILATKSDYRLVGMKPFVDIFPTEEDRKRPTWETEYFLLHKFYIYWGDVLDKLIQEAVTLYPEHNDFDLAYYYVKEKLKNR